MAKKKAVAPLCAEGEPEHFPHELLDQSPAERQRFFEHQCIIDHPRLQDACAQVIREICVPGRTGTYVRKGATVLVIGTSRVGKTTLIQLLEQELLGSTLSTLQKQQAMIPFASVLMAGAENGRFDWRDYYEAVLRALYDPFVRPMSPRVRTRDIRIATLEAIKQRKPIAILVDEAHHLAKKGKGPRLQDQMDVLKAIENETGVSHVLVGTYEMRPFRSVNPQLACRSVDIHFSRYDASNATDLQHFRSLLWAFQCLLPVASEPALKDDHWQFLYGASLGCVGILKHHLDRALSLALASDADTVTLDHLQRTALSHDRRSLAWQAIIEGEKDLAGGGQTEQQWLQQLGVMTPTAPKKRRRSETTVSPFHRLPGRDTIGKTLSTESMNEKVI
jgi:hypothetical protein